MNFDLIRMKTITKESTDITLLVFIKRWGRRVGKIFWNTIRCASGTCNISRIWNVVSSLIRVVRCAESSGVYKNKPETEIGHPFAALQRWAPTNNGARRTITFASYLFFSPPRYTLEVSMILFCAGECSLFYWNRFWAIIHRKRMIWRV